MIFELICNMTLMTEHEETELRRERAYLLHHWVHITAWLRARRERGGLAGI